MIHLNIGSNLKSRFGGKFANIEKTLNLISKENISIEKISSFYKTPSYPNRSNPYFVNLGINIRTKIQPIDLLKKLKNIERIIGRASKLKKEDGVSSDNYWKSTKPRMTKIAERLLKVSQKLREIAS